ncbi:MAG: hypothetical protein QMB62_00520 [Oscillospiraceae bacterium]
MGRVKLVMKAAQIEFNWWLIRRERRKGAALLKRGHALSSTKMLRLNRRYSKHCAIAVKAQREYEHFAGNGKIALKMRI